MKNNLKLSATLFCLLFFLLPAAASADFANGDTGIQKVHQASVPQLNSSGVIQNSYTSDSFFPLFLYWYDSNRVAEIKAAGFNALWSLNWNGRSIAEQLTILNQYGVKLFPALQTFIRTDVANGNWNLLTNAVNTYKTNTGVLNWWLTNENYADVTSDKWLAAYNVIKSLDPNRAVMGERGYSYVNNITRCFPLKVDLSYIYSYPIDKARTTLGNLTYPIDHYLSYGCPLPLIVLAQAFYDRNGGSWPVMPTAEQVRSQMYVAIVHGATGVGMFVGFLNDTSAGTGEKLVGLLPGTPQWAAVSQANHEIEANKRIFLSKTSTDIYHVDDEVNGSCQWFENDCAQSKPPIHTLLKDTGEPGVRYLLAVNLDYYSANGRFTFTDNLTKVTSVFDNRALTPSGTSFTDGFSPYAARLYKIETGSVSPSPSPYTCTLTAPPTATAGTAVNLSMNTTGSPGSVALYAEKTPGSGNSTTNQWDQACFQNGTSCSGTNTFSNPGTYWVTCNAWTSGGSACSGNPYVTYPYTGTDGTVWQDCGAGSRKQVTVTDQPVTMDISILRQTIANFINIFSYNQVISGFGKASLTPTPTPTSTPTPAQPDPRIYQSFVWMDGKHASTRSCAVNSSGIDWSGCPPNWNTVDLTNIRLTGTGAESYASINSYVLSESGTQKLFQIAVSFDGTQSWTRACPIPSSGIQDINWNAAGCGWGAAVSLTNIPGVTATSFYSEDILIGPTSIGQQAFQSFLARDGVTSYGRSCLISSRGIEWGQCTPSSGFTPISLAFTRGTGGESYRSASSYVVTEGTTQKLYTALVSVDGRDSWLRNCTIPADGIDKIVWSNCQWQVGPLSNLRGVGGEAYASEDLFIGTGK